MQILTQFGRCLAALCVVVALHVPALAQSLEIMAGQMILVGFQGDDVEDAGVVALREDIAAGRVGGVMFLRTNVTSLSAVREMNRRFQEASDGMPPPLLAIDQEGGLVERLTEAVGFAETPSAKDVARASSPERAKELYARMAGGLADVGFNLNFGPVVDLDLNPENPVIGRFGRSYSADPDVVISYAEAFVAAHRDPGVLTALKHFPGHGSSDADSHEGFTDVSDSWQESELEPYRALIADDMVDLVMSAHIYHDRYDSMSAGDNLPASLSPVWIGQVLRRGLGFDGVVVSDDMEMGAIRQHFSLEESITRAVWAGADILLFSNTANARTSLAAEVQAVLVREARADPEFLRRVEQSYQRIVALKQQL